MLRQHHRMPRRPQQLPPELRGHAFTTRSAVEAGVDKKRLRGADLDHPFRGIHVAGAPADLIARCAAYLPRMPSAGFFCGPTAALVLGVPLPRRLEESGDLHVAVPGDCRAVRRSGIVGHKLEVDAGSLCEWRGLRITAPSRTWRDLATHLRDDDLVAAGDFLLGGDRPLVSPAELAAEVRAAAGARGVRALTRALPLLDGRAGSRRESLLRLILVRAGIAGFEPNHWVVLTRPAVRYRIDIAFPDAHVGLEYQGEYHHDIDQWRRDMTRLSRLRAAGWTMVELSSHDLRDPGELTFRIRRILRQPRPPRGQFGPE
jgi:very-short-patch-repair endonuclease